MTPFNNNQAHVNPPTASDNPLAAAVNEPPPSTTSSFFPSNDSTSNLAKLSREELLQVGANISSLHGLELSELLMPGFHPGGFVNGNSSRAWGKSHDANGNNDPTICWNAEGNSDPLLLREMTAEEQEVGTDELSRCCATSPVPAPRFTTTPVSRSFADYSLSFMSSCSRMMSTHP